jgi:hypothetical protein
LPANALNKLFASGFLAVSTGSFAGKLSAVLVVEAYDLRENKLLKNVEGEEELVLERVGDAILGFGDVCCCCCPACF